jgi:asparagine synthase (glutamine-hydrolysing)
MCGIFGILNKNSSTISYNPEYINRSFKKGYKRGPEQSNYQVVNDFTEFGFHRLAINGLNDNSTQPICIEGCILICNGEIYNYKELYASLLSKNVMPYTDSDCEIIIHMYKHYGIHETLLKINGEFAFALYDTDKCLMYLARDPIGVRPLYTSGYLDQNIEQVIYFASEIKMLHPFINSQMEIEQFKPGSYITMHENLGKWSLYNKPIQYYEPYNFNSHIRGCECFNCCRRYMMHITAVKNDNRPILRLINKTLNECVKRRVTTSDRPIACLLSGGLDSSLITALVSKYYDKGQLETYSIGLPGSEDLKFSQIVADHLGTKHTQVIMTEQEFFDAIPEVIESIESYDTTTVRASVGNYLIAKYIAQHSQAKVIFNGDGSDEITGGYMYFHNAPDHKSFDAECYRLLGDIHNFDVLRSDKSVASNGLEPRTPFLDKEFIDAYMSIPSQIRFHPGNNKCEKFLLRSAFECENILPKEVLWRTKEAFSDGVSSLKKSWYQIIDEKICASLGEVNNFVTKFNPPQTREQRYYRTFFENVYPDCGYIIPYFWMPRFVNNATDSSARTLSIYNVHI